MVRTVKVQLEADTGRYVPPVERAKEATEGLDRKVEALDRDLNKIPADAAKAAAAMKLLGDESGKAGLKLDELGKKSTGMEEIDRRLVKTRGEVKLLADEFNRTGNASTLEKLFGKQGEADELEKLKGQLSKALGDAGTSGGRAGALNFVKSFTSMVKDPAAAGGIGVAGLAAGAFAGAALNGALLAGLASGGIALGIIGQAKNPAVRAAWADTGHFISGELTKATSGFERPLVVAAHILRDDIGQAIKGIDFDRLAQSVEPLARGLGGLVTHTVPGLNAALTEGSNILDKFSSQLPSIGDALSDALRRMSEGSKGAAEGLTTLVMAGKFAIRMAGDLVLGLSKTYEWLVNVGVKLSWWADAIGHNIPVLGGLTSALHDFFETVKSGDTGTEVLVHQGETLADALRRVANEAEHTDDGLANLMQKINQTKVTTDSLAEAMTTKLLTTMMSLDRAALGFDESLTHVGDSLRQNGKSLDEHSAKGQANREAILGMVGANIAQYQAMVAAGASVDEATAKYNANQAQIEKTATAAYGNTAAVHGMIDKYKDVPGKVQTEIAMNGLTAAIDQLGDLLREIYGLPPRRDIYLTVHHDEIVRQINQDMGHVQRFGGIYQHAQEGLLSAKVYSPMNPGRYMIAEPATGGEAFVPRFGDYRRSTSILDQASRWYGGRFAPGGMGGGGSVVTVPITINAGMGADGYALGRQIAETLRPYINGKGGNVQVALGR